MTTISTETQDSQVNFVVSIDDRDTPTSHGDMGIFGKTREPLIMAIDVPTLRANFEQALDAVCSVFSNVGTPSPGLPLESISLSFEVTATGKVAFLGTGAETSGKGAITLTFKRS